MQNVRNKAEAADRKAGREPGWQYECRICKFYGLDKRRDCWADDGTRPVTVHDPETGVPVAMPLIVDKPTLRAMLPDEEPLRYLRERVRADGKELCPVTLAHAEGLETVLQMEADLDAWHVAPLSGPSTEWPSELLRVLRHLRGLRGVLQMRNIWDGQKDEKPPPGQGN